MPLYYLECKRCGQEVKVVCRPDQIDNWVWHSGWTPVEICGGELVRKPRGPTNTVHEVLDNGKMARSVERFSEAERLTKERSKSHK